MCILENMYYKEQVEMIVCTSIHVYTGLWKRDFVKGTADFLTAAKRCSDKLFKGFYSQSLLPCVKNFDNALVRKYVNLLSTPTHLTHFQAKKTNDAEALWSPFFQFDNLKNNEFKEAEAKDNLFAFGCKYYKGKDKPIACKYNHFDPKNAYYARANELKYKRKYFEQEQALRKKKFAQFDKQIKKVNSKEAQKKKKRLKYLLINKKGHKRQCKKGKTICKHGRCYRVGYKKKKKGIHGQKRIKRTLRKRSKAGTRRRKASHYSFAINKHLKVGGFQVVGAKMSKTRVANLAQEANAMVKAAENDNEDDSFGSDDGDF